MKHIDVIIVGGGPAGLAAAIGLKRKGIRGILILERENGLGGILRQCIHDGFGLTRFGENLSGPEYAQRFIDEAESMGIGCLTNTTVLDISPGKVVTAVSNRHGYLRFQAKAVILAMGCRERTRGAIGIPGARPSGVVTAGVAQNYINLQNKMIGKEAVILGSGDIGLIMARRLTLEGAHVKGVFEALPYSSGLARNVEQCLHDYDIPLYLSHTVTGISGRSRLEAVTVAQLDERQKPIPETGREIPCDTLVLSVGLIPENELSLSAGVTLDSRTRGAVVDENYQTSVEGVFSAGNVLHVHDLVDFVSLEAEALAGAAARYLSQGALPACTLGITPGKNVGHTIPQAVSGTRDFTLSLRVTRPMKSCTVTVAQNGRAVFTGSMRRALPAEMIQIPISGRALSPEENLEVSVV